jgi:hypothetical protein
MDLISIVVPAHNEEEVIARAVCALIAGAQDGELEVIVVCNGCKDRTAEAVRQLRGGEAVRVLETDVASKAHALNLGDSAARGFPRFYVDADVSLSLASVRLMALRLQKGDVLAASPLVRLNLTNCSWAVRAFYDIDRRLPSARETIGGSGVYALSEGGRGRFDQFPQLTADDAFVRLQFKPNERCAVEGCYSTVTPPKTLKGVILIKTRSHFGNYELAQSHPQLRRNIGDSNRPALMKLAMRPWMWPRLAVYAYVKVKARLRAIRRFKGHYQQSWERDESSRQAI